MAAGDFSRAAKDELARHIPGRACCRWAELVGIVQSTGTWSVEGTGAPPAGELVLRLSSGPVARKAIRLVRKTMNGGAAPVLVRQSDPGAPNYHVRIGAAAGAEKIHRVLGSLKALAPAASVQSALLRRACCKRSYARGLFLGRGSISDPRRGHHLEIGLRNAADVERLTLALRALGIDAKVGRRGAGSFVYLKDADQIVELLLQMGAHAALLHFEDAQVRKSVRNEINRLVNAETANVDKTIAAAMRQIEAIRTLQRTGELDALPQRYRELARLRLEHPYANFAELGHLLSRPLTKSGVSYRMKRMMRLAGLPPERADGRPHERAAERLAERPTGRPL